MRVAKSILVLILVLFAFTVQAASKEWLHVRVDDRKGEGEKVKINIPLSIVEAMLPMVEEKAVEKGRIRLENKDIQIAELRTLWKAIKDEGDNEYVTVEKKGETVRVFTKGKFFHVVTDKDSDKQVNIQIPLQVVDAMLSGEGEELNLMAAVKALKESGVRDLITVEEEDATVRVWIDENNQAQ